MEQRFTFNKSEKLKSRKRIDLLFKKGKTFSVFPYRVYFLVEPAGAARDGIIEDGHVAGAVSAGEASPIGDGAAGEGIFVGEGTAASGGGNGKKMPAVQAGFGASTRNFKKAVDRNRIKRLGREAYRLQKAPLLQALAEKELHMSLFFIYTGKQLPDYAVVSEKIGVALQKLLKETA